MTRRHSSGAIRAREVGAAIMRFPNNRQSYNHYYRKIFPERLTETASRSANPILGSRSSTTGFGTMSRPARCVSTNGRESLSVENTFRPSCCLPLAMPNALPVPLASLSHQSPEYAVKLVDAVLQLAVDRSASDVHLQPRRDAWEILLRIDGVLNYIGEVPKGASTDPVARLLVLAGLPTYQAGRPLEGRIQRDYGADIDMRLGTFPTVHGFRAVIRLFPKRTPLHDLDLLGLGEEVTSSLEELVEQTDGAILLTGPAGSGKTTTLYACLRRIASDSTARRSVVTIEDPVESVIEGISQSQIDAAGGMTLAAALRGIVRQDPEVLLVSEIRDPETAEAALQAALTGHLVFSSLHAADVVTALRRLEQMGLPSHLCRSGIRAVCSQRLLRRKCDACRSGQRDAPGAGSASPCPRCGGTGYQGRVAIAELIRLDGSDPAGEVITEMLAAGATIAATASAAVKAGMVPLHERANALVAAGVTDELEVFRVLGRRHPTP